MKTILITGHDTMIGKTWVMRYIAKDLSERKETVQVVKPVETGVAICKEMKDVDIVLDGLNSQYVTGHTLYSFEAPLAPLPSAEKEGAHFDLGQVIKEIKALPEADWRMIETAGGIAVPLDSDGRDGRDLAIELEVDYIVLVIQNRLGAINQARLLEAYTPKENCSVGFWLNDTTHREALVTSSNGEALRALETPIWAHHGFQAEVPEYCSAPFIK